MAISCWNQVAHELQAREQWGPPGLLAATSQSSAGPSISQKPVQTAACCPQVQAALSTYLSCLFPNLPIKIVLFAMLYDLVIVRLLIHWRNALLLWSR